MTNRLTGKNFIDQLARYGYFAEQFPDCFSSESLADHLPTLLPLIHTGRNQLSGKKNHTSPATLSTYKNDVSRRVLSVANPEAFLRLAKYMANNWDEISRVAYSRHSLSPITFMHSYSATDVILNCESAKEKFRAKSDYMTAIKKCILMSLGYKYRLKVDISNCYNSIYTHSVTWAICGKELAKTYLRTQQPESIAPDYQMGDFLDGFIRHQKNDETNGIIVGPFTSRVFSEIILAHIDKKIAEKGWPFKRYVDDFSIYFRTEAQAHESLPTIEKILNEFNLSLNTAKTQISKFPYEIISPIKETYDNALKSNGVFGVLNAAAQLHLKGEKGAYKYALKYLQNHPIPPQDFLTILSTLVNIMLLDPRHGKYVGMYLKKNLAVINYDILFKAFNKELECSLQNDLQQEALVFIQLIKDLGGYITAQNLINTIKSDNDFAIIIALDIWKNHRSCVRRNKHEARLINDSINALMSTLNGEKLSGSRWLLLYELHIHKFVPAKQLPTWEGSPFFDKMAELNISFYKR